VLHKLNKYCTSLTLHYRNTDSISF